MFEYSAQEDYVLNTVKSRDVHFLRLWFSDVLGNLKSFAIVPNELRRAFEIGIPMDGNCITSFESKTESDIIAWPVASSFQILPWRPNENCVARMFCDLKTPDGNHFSSDTRNILKKVLEKASDLGYVVNIKPKIEHYYFKDSTGPEPLDAGTSFDLTPNDSATDLRRDTILTLEKLGIPVEKSQHASGPSQQEIDLRTQDALSIADSVITYKLVVKEIAQKHGAFASFMPKPLNNVPGSGMHLNIHLSNENEENIFFDKGNKDEYCLSLIAKQFIAGILKYISEFCLITNQYNNSYRRLNSNTYKSNKIAWSHSNKASIIRVPQHRPASEECTRIELRNVDPATNPYLAFACIISAGLLGIEEKLNLEDSLENAEEKMHDVCVLPCTLGQAIDNFSKSSLMKKTLGEDVFEYILRVKRKDWKNAISYVNEFEIDKFLAVL